VWAFSFTIRRKTTAEEWRRLWHRFVVDCRRFGFYFIYRVELQRRKQAHCHASVWLADGIADAMQVKKLWMDTITPAGSDGRRVYDWDEYDHAVFFYPVANEGWAVYQAIHHGKSKREQLGWVGKQWGIVGRDHFVKRVCREVVLSSPQRAKFQRIVRGWLRSRQGRRTKLSALGSWMRCLPAAGVEKALGWVTR
jgi:predicted 3-demethylubiquinone-9 3-methyltransferase (glyoxalase superfamily)